MTERDKSIYVRVTEDEKKKIKRQADICGLSLSEYLRKVSIGFVPKALPPDTFFSMTEKLTRIYEKCQGKISEQTRQELVHVIEELYKKYLVPEKKKEVMKMATTGLWPIKALLRNVLDYASNPDKTIEKKFLDDELGKVIDYAVSASSNFHAFYRYKRKPLSEIAKSMSQAKYVSGVQATLMLFTELLKLVMGNNIDKESPRPVSPEVRAACAFYDKYMKQRHLLEKYNLNTDEEIGKFIVEKNDEMQVLYEKRNKASNKIRRCKDEDEKSQLKEERSEISKELKPFREEYQPAKDILVLLSAVRELLRKEQEAEQKITERKKVR